MLQKYISRASNVLRVWRSIITWKHIIVETVLQILANSDYQDINEDVLVYITIFNFTKYLCALWFGTLVHMSKRIVWILSHKCSFETGPSPLNSFVLKLKMERDGLRKEYIVSSNPNLHHVHASIFLIHDQKWSLTSGKISSVQKCLSHWLPHKVMLTAFLKQPRTIV